MRTPIEAHRPNGGPWKPAELSYEAELANRRTRGVHNGIDEPLGVADVFAIKANADSNAGLIEAAMEAGFTVVEA